MTTRKKMMLYVLSAFAVLLLVACVYLTIQPSSFAAYVLTADGCAAARALGERAETVDGVCIVDAKRVSLTQIELQNGALIRRSMVAGESK